MTCTTSLCSATSVCQQYGTACIRPPLLQPPIISLACGPTMGQTDRQIPYQFTDPATHTMETQAINNHCLHQCSITKVRYG